MYTLTHTHSLESDDCIRIENKNIHLICNKLHSKKNSSVWLPYTFVRFAVHPNGNGFLFRLVCINFLLAFYAILNESLRAFERLILAARTARMHDALRYFVTHIRFIFIFSLSLSLSLLCLCLGFAICKCGRRRRRSRVYIYIVFDCLSVCSTLLYAVTIACWKLQFCFTSVWLIGMLITTSSISSTQFMSFRRLYAYCKKAVTGSGYIMIRNGEYGKRQSRNGKLNSV